MTISLAQSNPVQYVGNGSAATFAYPWKISAATDLIVGLVTGSGYVPQDRSVYRVAGVGNDGGGSITFLSAPAAGTLVDIRTHTPRLQMMEFANLGVYLPENTTSAMDSVVRMIQDLARLVYTYGVHGPDEESRPWAALPVALQRANKALLFDDNGQPTVGTVIPQALTQALIGQHLYPQTAAETAAGVTPTNHAYASSPRYDVRRTGAACDGIADDTAALNRAISVLTHTTSFAGYINGGTAVAPPGTSILSSTVLLPNNVRLVGADMQSSLFVAAAGFSGAAVFHANNGTHSLFGSLLEDLAINCNNVAGLGGILSDAWQENSGPRRCLIYNFATYGIRYQNGFGGAALSVIRDCNIFGSTTANAIGVDVGPMGTSGAFMLIVEDMSITGGKVALLKGINIVNCQCHLKNVHFEVCAHGVYLNGSGNHTLIGITGNETVTNLVTIDPAFTGTVTMLGCFRNGSKVLVNDLRVRQISLLGTISGGSGYANGTYNDVPLTGGSGSRATAQIVVSGRAVRQVYIANPGTNYAAGDSLSTAAASLGGTGSGFSVPVIQVFSGVGAVSADYGRFELGPPASTQLIGNAFIRSPGGDIAFGSFDGTVAGTHPCANSFGVSSVQRIGAGRYKVTLAYPAAAAHTIFPIATCADPALTVSCAQAGATTFTIAIENSATGVPADQSAVIFRVTGI